MQLGYLLEESYDTLFNAVPDNLNLYASGNDWLEEFFGGTEFYKNSSVSVDQFSPYLMSRPLNNAQKAEEDLINVRNLYDAFKNLTPWQASNKYMWTYLCHAIPSFREYVRVRWGEAASINTVRTRYFVTTMDSLRNDNALSRLWWYGRLTYEENADDKYHLTRILLSNETIATDVMDTLNRCNPNRMKGLLLAIEAFKEEASGESSLVDRVRACNRFLNRYAATTKLDYLSVEEIKAIALGALRESSI